ncbi:MAG: hypothetical protein ABIG28_01515 [archaeon]
MAKKEDKFVTVVLFVVAIVLIVSSLIIVFKSVSERPLQVVEYDVYFEVATGGIGFDVDNTLLTYGQVTPGGGGRRRVVISNDYDFLISVDVLISENLQGLFDVETGQVIESGKNKTILVDLDIPSDFPLGNYTGKIRFEMYKLDE